MKTNQLLLALAPLLLSGGLATAAPVGSAFSYNGLLHDNGAPANGPFDLRFQLFDDPAAGSPVGTALALEDVAINNGLFTVTLDFGATVFDGSARFLEIGLRPGATTGSFNTLSTRQPVLPTPEALHAAKTDNSVPSGSLTVNDLTVQTVGVPDRHTSLLMLQRDSVVGANRQLSPSFVIPRDSTWVFDILVLGRSRSFASTSGATIAAYQIRGVADWGEFGLRILGATTTTLAESQATYDSYLRVVPDGSGNSVVVVEVDGDPTFPMKWVASARLAQVTFP